MAQTAARQRGVLAGLLRRAGGWASDREAFAAAAAARLVGVAEDEAGLELVLDIIQLVWLIRAFTRSAAASLSVMIGFVMSLR
jgi:hypothetical protein